MRAVVAGTLAVTLALPLAGCESTRDKAKKFAQEGSTAFRQKGLVVTSANAQVQVVDTSVLTDANGSAAVAQLRNTGPKDLAAVPVSLTVSGADGKPVYRNNAPGLEKGLVSVPILPTGKPVYWVNDQVQASAKPAKATVVVGAAKPAGKTTALTVTPGVISGDPDSGIQATGNVTNTTSQLLAGVIISGVSVKGSKVVAAGRAIIQKLPAGKTLKYTIFFIGDPRGGQLMVSASPVPTP